MSNTAEVTPFVTGGSALAGAAVAGVPGAALVTGAAVLGMVTMMFAAMETTEREREILAGYKQQQRRDRLAATRLNLSFAEAGDLIGAAKAMGYTPLDARPRRIGDTARPMMLANGKGDTLLLHSAGGGMILAGSAGDRAVKAVVRQCTLEATRRHLEGVGGRPVAARTLANGEVELRATELVARADGAASLTARVGADGVTRVEIDGVRGQRCDKVLADFTRAVGGEAVNKKLKPAYYQVRPIRPGEPARVKAR